MAYSELDPNRIEVKRGSPPLDETIVAALMESMAVPEIGLINPITIWRPSGLMPEVIAGRHRLEAAKRLGWDVIRCNDIGLNHVREADKAETIEIVENIHRRELALDEKDALIARYVELKAKEVLTTALSKPQGGRPKGAVTKVAEELGFSRQGIRQALVRAKAREEPSKPVAPEPDPFPPRRAREALRALQALDEEERGWVLDQMKGGAFD